MISIRQLRSLTIACPALFFAACKNVEFTRVALGESARVAFEMKKNPPLPARVVNAPGALPTPAADGIVDMAPMPLPPPPVGIVPEPSLPDPAFAGDRVADLYVSGCAAMKAGKNDEAIKSLEDAVELDPSFADAWTKLVVLYQNTGQQKKALEAYRKVKQLGQPSGAGGSLSGGLGLVP